MPLSTQVPICPPLDSLTAQERKIMRLLAEGLTNINTADKLCCSVHTVKNHKENIKAKLALASCQDLLKIAIKYSSNW